MKTLIEGYRSFPGEHCGSVATRGLLHHYCGLDLPESAVFGLGAGLECMVLESPAMDPALCVFGRTGTLEVDAAASLGIDYRERPEADDAEAWQIARDEVLAGRPTMLSGDIFYLDYREFKVHFPAHRFVLVGFDDDTEKVYIADRIRPEPEACSYAALAKSRNAPEGLSSHNLWGRFHGTEVTRDLVAASRSATLRCARRMLGEGQAAGSDEGGLAFPVSDGTRIASGVAAIRRLADQLPSWGERADAAWIASFNARCIEKFGNGGGNFRRLYAGYLAWARDLDPEHVPAEAAPLAVRAADGWTAISAALGTVLGDDARPEAWREAATRAGEVAEVERELFSRLLERAEA